MARFIVVHRLPAMMTQDELRKEAQAVVSALPDDVEWLRSWVVYEGDRLFCEWEASEEEAIRAALKATKAFPVEAIHAVEPIDPGWFRS